MAATPEVPARRRIERRELITLFNSLQPGEEITPHEIFVRTGLEISQPGDRNLVWSVREHCRDVIGFCIEYTKDGNLRRETDSGVISGLLPRRAKKIRSQLKRGIAESVAIRDFEALSREHQLRLLAYQSNFDTLALVTQPKVVEQITNFLRDQKMLAMADAETVLAAARAIKQ